MTDDPNTQQPSPLDIRDEPGMAERFQRGLRNLLNTPPKPRTATGPKPKERRAPKSQPRKRT
jgi:hypothetical protein